MITIKCDRCGKELSNNHSDLDFAMTDTHRDLFAKFGQAIGERTNELTRPHLCSKCVKGYNKIISNTNKEIEAYLKER